MENIKQDIAAENQKESVSGEKEKILTADNSWNKQGLIQARTNEDSEIVCCTATKKELFYIKKSGGIKVMLASFGKCPDCGLYFHEEYLHTFDGVDQSRWPVEYQNMDCKVCWAKPIEE